MPCWWVLTRTKQLSMAATAGVTWLCACVRYCRPRGWCLSVSFAFSCFNSSSAHPPRAIVGHFPKLSIPGIGHYTSIQLPRGIWPSHFFDLLSPYNICRTLELQNGLFLQHEAKLGLNLAWISLDFIESKSRNEENKTFLSPTPGHLNNFFAPLPVYFKKILIPGGRPGGGGWVLLELTDALCQVKFLACATCMFQARSSSFKTVRT